jgi:hypothetical protein
VLVISDRPSSPPCLGLEVDRVLGFVDGQPAANFAQRGAEPVVERRPFDGRLLQVVDAPRLVARARKVIEDALARGE